MDGVPKEMTKIDFDTRRITLDEECTVRELYSRLKKIWVTDQVAIMFPFPMEYTDVNDFEMVNKWKIENPEKIKDQT